MWKSTYKGIVGLENGLGHFFLLFIRLYWGSQLLFIGFEKWLHLQATASFFHGLGIPYPTVSAYLVATVETIGGISLILGLFSRLVMIPVIIVFAVAYATAHADSLQNLTTVQEPFLSQKPFLFLYTALVVLCFGAGAFSFDYWFEKKQFGRHL